MSTLAAVLARNARIHGDRCALKEADRSWTWRQWVGCIARTASMLQSLGLRRGHRFGILATNSARQAELTFAGYWSGSVPVPVNHRLAPPEIAAILADAGCATCFVDPAFGTTAAAVQRDWNGSMEAIAETPAGSGLEVMTPVPGAPADEALLLYTGGTTGRSKGVPLSHRNIIANGMQVAMNWHTAADDVVLHVPPMFHSAELVKTAYLLNGAANVYLPRFDAETLLRTIEQHRVSFVLLVPTMLVMTLDSGLVDRFDTRSVRQLIYGAAPMGRAWIERTCAAFPGTAIAQGYGLTETSPLLTLLDDRAHRAALQGGDEGRLASCGRPLPGIDVVVFDETGHALGPDECGEVRVRGDNVFAGYHARPQLNATAFVDGWFRTGDIGCFDADGYLYLKDRTDDVIRSGGEKVYSNEVEQALASHPAVAEAVVIGVPDEIYGQRVVALVRPVPGTVIDQDALIGHCRGRIGGFKLPRRIEFVDVFPKSAMGKILKTELRRRYLEE